MVCPIVLSGGKPGGTSPKIPSYFWTMDFALAENLFAQEFLLPCRPGRGLGNQSRDGRRIKKEQCIKLDTIEESVKGDRIPR